MNDIQDLQPFNIQDAVFRYNKYKQMIEERIKKHQVPHNKKFKQGFYIPKRPLKCMNIMETQEPQPIIWRSSWEQKFCQFCDETQSITRWGSEILSILYKDPIRNKMAYYFPDFYVEYIDNNKALKKVLIEVKPLKEATLSEAKNGYDRLMVSKNAMKWKAAIEFCKKRGIDFKVMHEHNFGL